MVAALTPAAVGQPSHTRVLTAERDDELLDLVNELADRIRDTVLGSALASVVRIDFEGIEGIEERFGDQLKTKVDEIYDPAALREDLARALGRR